MEPILNRQWIKLVQMQHPEKLLPFARHLDDNTLAAVYGLNVDTYLTIKGLLSQQARETAKQLLADPEFADRVDHLPFKAGETVIGVGESTTDDLLSWFEILRHLLDLQRPQDEILLINEGISGQTTTQVLGRFSSIVAKQLNWIFCMIGSNDAMRVGVDPTKTQVSLEETAQNLAAIRSIAATRTKSQWVWLTPPTIDEERVAAFTYFQQSQLTWRNADILAIGDMIRKLPDLVVDVQAGFGKQTATAFLEIDGLHPTIVGQKAIAKLIVENLTGGSAG
ncbi:SGNH/GDSL hydrolase family protein [Paenibacillus sp. KN14-4R]|uniref:SGNH/GDSL hydrolase family protein n=1 Tax=Paenibacillus sp. KN14-4R TaxID=3445773 RepID=UPI003FA04002